MNALHEANTKKVDEFKTELSKIATSLDTYSKRILPDFPKRIPALIENATKHATQIEDSPQLNTVKEIATNTVDGDDEFEGSLEETQVSQLHREVHRNNMNISNYKPTKAENNILTGVNAKATTATTTTTTPAAATTTTE